MDKELSKQAVDAVIRSLLSAAEFAQYEKTGLYNLGNGFLNRMILDFTAKGYLNVQQHTLLKKRLSSCELNVHLDDLPNVKRHGPFLSIEGGRHRLESSQPEPTDEPSLQPPIALV